MINIIQIGIGALGRQVLQFLSDRDGVNIVGVVDLNAEYTGKDISEFIKTGTAGVTVSQSLNEALSKAAQKPEVAVLTTVSSIDKLAGQVEQIANAGLHIVSTCEELTFPWKQHPEAAGIIDSVCKKNNVTCLGTGVNPGFLMDYLSTVFTSVCQRVDSITIERVQDASVRRIPFQMKIGAALSHDEFNEEKSSGRLRHVGLPESIDLIARAMGWELDENLETLEPVIAGGKITNGYKQIEKGNPAGVKQVGTGIVDGVEVIKLIFKAAVGEERSYDRITIKGLPDISTEIEGGLNGDIATCAITVNALRSVIQAPPGLQTMLDVPVPAYFSKV